MKERARTPDDARVERQAQRTGRLRTVLGSSDFYLGVPLGASLAGLPLVYEDVASQIPTILLAASGIAAGLAALVLAAMTVLLGVFGSAYREMLLRVPGGVAGTLVPYRQVIAIAAGASIVSLVAATLWPALTDVSAALRWLNGAVPLGLLCWSILGCMQVVDQLVEHVVSNQRAEDLERRKAAALAKREGRLTEIEKRGRVGD